MSWIIIFIYPWLDVMNHSVCRLNIFILTCLTFERQLNHRRILLSCQIFYVTSRECCKNGTIFNILLFLYEFYFRPESCWRRRKIPFLGILLNYREKKKKRYGSTIARRRRAFMLIWWSLRPTQLAFILDADRAFLRSSNRKMSSSSALLYLEHPA